MFKQAFTFACLCTLLSGCSILVSNALDDKTDSGTGGMDGGGTDSGRDMGTNPDMGTDPDMEIVVDGDVVDAQLGDCTGLSDGVNCSPGGSGSYICVGEVCALSTCGDSYIDSAAGEECEDHNLTSGDGCEPSTCHFTCSSNEQCDDGEPCNGSEMCNIGLHRCQVGLLPADNTPCTSTTVTTGVCRGGMCALASCGDGTVESSLGEECDDMNTNSGDGCENSCIYSCHGDDECNDGNVCNGAEMCDLSQHKCVAGAALGCDDFMPCTTDSCDPISGCQNVLADADSDGVSWITCYAGYGTDCDDGDNSVFPGAPQMCDGRDHNCDGMTDDGSLSITCYADSDMDSFGNAGMTMVGCSCPGGFIPARADGQYDCVDFQSQAYPMAPDFHTDYAMCRRWIFTGSGSACISQDYDWDCNGTEELQYTNISSGCYSFSGSCFGSGWTGVTEVPGCGVEANYRSCLNNFVGTGGCLIFNGTAKQGCR